MKTPKLVSLALSFATLLGLAACAATTPADENAAADGPLDEISAEVVVSTITDSSTTCTDLFPTTCRLVGCFGNEREVFPNRCVFPQRECAQTVCTTSTSARVGIIRNESGGGCLSKDSIDTLRTCNGDLPIRLWRFEDNLIKSQDAQCLSGDNATGQVSIKLCANASRWVYDTDGRTFKLQGTNKCLFGQGNGAIGDRVDVRDCGIAGQRFQWSLVKP